MYENLHTPFFKMTPSLLLSNNIIINFNTLQQCRRENYKLKMSLSFCSDEEYTCDDGNCVDMDHRQGSYI